MKPTSKKHIHIYRAFARRQQLFDQRHAMFPFKPTDILLVSYPRSGNTWARTVLSYIMAAMHNDPIKDRMDRIAIYTPSIYKQVPETDIIPRIIKTHSHYLPAFQKVQKCIYICRDGRDAAVSYYYYRQMEDVSFQEMPFSEFLTDFFMGTRDMFIPWQANVTSWLFNPVVTNDRLLVRYEDMLKDPVAEFMDMARFIGLSCSRDLIAEAVDQCKLERLQQKEKSDPESFKRLFNPKANERMLFFRQGKTGGHQKLFSARDMIHFSFYCGDVMERLGYERPLSPAVAIQRDAPVNSHEMKAASARS